MRLERMGASHPTRLSFMRQLVRRLHEDRAAVTRMLWDIDSDGYGSAVYTLCVGGRSYSLCAFTSQLADEDRTDRVIAEAWDAAFVLFDGIPGSGDMQRMRHNAVRQEAGRYCRTDLVLSRANKSMRMFEHVVSRLADGRQPDASMISRIGYLMRTTAVYGNGKFGLADRAVVSERSAMAAPFQPELLTVWLIRGFTHDLVEHLAASRNPEGAATLSQDCRRDLGIGNATGLGMAPFLISHPILLHNWIAARETALADVCALERAGDGKIDRFLALLERARRHVADIEVSDAAQSARNRILRIELEALTEELTAAEFNRPFPWRRLIKRTSALSLECQEMLVSLVIEPHGEIADCLCAGMASETEAELDPSATTGDLRRAFELNCAWTRDIDFSEPDQHRMFWYVSEEKLEPRLGDRLRDAGAEAALPLDVARQYRDLDTALAATGSEIVAEFLARRPSLRHAVRRLQTLAECPYAEIRGNLVEAAMRPIDLLRSKLAFFGATHFDPKSDLWTRITLYKGAPDFRTVTEAGADDWCFPVYGYA